MRPASCLLGPSTFLARLTHTHTHVHKGTFTWHTLAPTEQSRHSYTTRRHATDTTLETTLSVTLDTTAQTISTTIYRFEAFKEYEKSGKLFWDAARRRVEFQYERETAMFGLVRDKDYEQPRKQQQDADDAPKGQRYDAWYDMIWMDRDVAFARGCTGCLYLWRRDRDLEMENGI